MNKFDYFNKVWKSNLSSQQKNLLCYLIAKSNEEWRSWPTTARLAQVAGVKYEKNFTLKDYLSGFVTVEKVGRQNHYILDTAAIAGLSEGVVVLKNTPMRSNTPAPGRVSTHADTPSPAEYAPSLAVHAPSPADDTPAVPEDTPPAEGTDTTIDTTMKTTTENTKKTTGARLADARSLGDSSLIDREEVVEHQAPRLSKDGGFAAKDSSPISAGGKGVELLPDDDFKHAPSVAGVTELRRPNEKIDWEQCAADEGILHGYKAHMAVPGMTKREAYERARKQAM